MIYEGKNWLQKAKRRKKAELQSQRDAQARAHALRDKEIKKETPAAPKIEEKIYPEWITEETVTENNRSIHRTVVKREGATTVFQKIIYTWGGIFYFMNESSISINIYDLEMKKQKQYFNK